MNVEDLVRCTDGGASSPDLRFNYPTGAVDDGDAIIGWSLENTNAGLSTVYIRFGDNASATPYIAINLAEDETVTQMFETPIPDAGGEGFFITVEAGSVDGVIWSVVS